MSKDSKQRNVIITINLWLTILVNLAMTVGFIVSMYSAETMDEVLGLGLCSMFTLVNILGAILLLKWNKYGLGLITISLILLSIVYAHVLNLGLIPTYPFIGTVIFLFLILQIRKGGKSAWSQLKSGWDSTHCRHIYQIFAVVELILFILTFIAFGGNRGKQSGHEPETVLQDTFVIEEQHPVKNISRDSIPDAPSVKSENSSPETSKDKSDKDVTDNQKSISDKDTPEKSPKKSYSIDDAAMYLDTHNVWNVSEMNQYPDLHNLNKLLMHSMLTFRDRLPSELTYKSKRLREISRLLREVEVERHSINNRELMMRLRRNSHRVIFSDNIDPHLIRNLLIETINEIRIYKAENSSGNEPTDSTPSVQKREKQRNIDGKSPADKDESEEDHCLDPWTAIQPLATFFRI